jgi:hypothetical protein
VTGGGVQGARIATVPVSAPRWLAGIVVLTVIGFQPSLTRTTNPIDWAHALHGITALGWSTTLGWQAWIAEQRRREAHRLLVMDCLLLALFMVVFAVAIAFVRACPCTPGR